MNLKLYYPVKPFQLNQGFGPENTFPELLPKYKELGLKGHNGWDFGTKTDGTLVRAAHDGVVTFTGLDGSGGELIVIRTLETFDYGYQQIFYKTIYGHLKSGSYKVKAGQRVRTGDILATADNTGWSTGAHLHFGLKPINQGEQDWQWFNYEPSNGYNGAIDPKPYFTGIYAENLALLPLYQQLLLLYRKLLEKIIGGRD